MDFPSQTVGAEITTTSASPSPSPYLFIYFYIIYQESLQLIGFSQENFEGLVGVD